MVNLDRENDWNTWEVITETGVHLGWVRSVRVAPKYKSQVSFVIVPIAIGWLPERFVGAYEVTNIELICVGVDQLLIVAEDAEQKLKQLNVGVFGGLSRKAQSSFNRLPITLMILGQSVLYLATIVQPSQWMRRKEEFYPPTSSTWRNDDGSGFQPALVPRRPSPNPLSDAVEIPLD